MKKVFDRWRNILKSEWRADCQCSGSNNGCPNCLIPPHSYAQRLDKAKGLELAHTVAGGNRRFADRKSKYPARESRTTPPPTYQI